MWYTKIGHSLIAYACWWTTIKSPNKDTKVSLANSKHSRLSHHKNAILGFLKTN